MDSYIPAAEPLTSWRAASRGLGSWRSPTGGGFSALEGAPEYRYGGLGQGSEYNYAGLAANDPNLNFGGAWQTSVNGMLEAANPGMLGNGTTQAAFDAAVKAAEGQGAGGAVGSPKGVIDPVSSGLQLGNAKGLNWDSVNQWDAQIAAAAEQWGIDPALIKAAIAMESGGVANPDQRNAPNSTGLLQIEKRWHADAAAEMGYNLDTPEGQIGYFAALMAGEVPGMEIRGNTPLERYINNYQGPEAGQTDPNYTKAYEHDVLTLMEMIDEAQVIAPGNEGGGGPSSGQMGHVADMWGGADVPMTQGLGSHEGEVYNNDPHIYDYAAEFGFEGHPGVDYGLPIGTELRSPLSGTVVNVGGPYFTDGAGGVGEIRVRAENGDIIIFGHMSTAGVRPGDKINVGDLIGATGQSDSRKESAHLHLEVRVLQPDGSYRIADPNTYFGGSAGVGTVAEEEPRRKRNQAPADAGGGGGGAFVPLMTDPIPLY
jgi:murein DD-endopeptidase MepM/ murein hydrolase activator NlpD